MTVRCFHCGHRVPITADQFGGETICPSCGGSIRLPEAEEYAARGTGAVEEPGRAWISSSISGLISLVFHMGLLLVFAAVNCDYRGGGQEAGEEVLIGRLPQVQLDERSDESLDAAAAHAAVESDDAAVAETLEVVTPLAAAQGDLSLDMDLSQFSPSGGARGAGPSISALAGGGGALGQGASFMGLRAQGSRFCIIADCSGSMEGPKLDFLKEEVLETLSTMAAQGRFQLLFFNSRAVPFPESGWRHPRRDRTAVAMWLQTLTAAGGTDPVPAFQQAFQLSPPPDAIFFMTDGLFEERAVDEVAQLNRRGGRNVQIHTISFLDAGPEPLMRKIASDSGGRYRHVAGF